MRTEFVFVFTDESYINIHHSQKKLYLPIDQTVDPKIGMKSRKGRRLVILHAIAEDGPLAERFENGEPVFNLKWSGDTPHSTSRLDNKKLLS